MSKKLKFWIVIFVLASDVALYAAFAGAEGFETVESILKYIAIFLGAVVFFKLLLWDWKEAKKDSTDKSFRLRK